MLFDTAVGWVSRLHEAPFPGKLDFELKRLRRYSVLIADEIDYFPFDQDAANLFFQLVSSRSKHADVISLKGTSYRMKSHQLRTTTE